MNWEELKSHLEPISKNFYTNIETDVQVSQAISLKRIADALEKLTKPPVIAEGVISEEEIIKAFSQPGYIVNKP